MFRKMTKYSLHIIWSQKENKFQNTFLISKDLTDTLVYFPDKAAFAY